MALGKIAKTTKAPLSTGRAKGRPKLPADAEQARAKAEAIGQSIVDLEDELDQLQGRADKLVEKLNATKLGQQLQQLRKELHDGNKRMKTLEQEAIPLIEVCEPETRRLRLPSQVILEVGIKEGSKSSANTLGNLKAILGDEEAERYWEALEPKQTKFIALERPDDA